MVRHQKSLCFELRPASGEKSMKSVHMLKEKAKEKGKAGGARFESGHHKSFMFRADSPESLEDWVSPYPSGPRRTSAPNPRAKPPCQTPAPASASLWCPSIPIPPPLPHALSGRCDPAACRRQRDACVRAET